MRVAFCIEDGTVVEETNTLMVSEDADPILVLLYPKNGGAWVIPVGEVPFGSRLEGFVNLTSLQSEEAGQPSYVNPQDLQQMNL